MKRMRKERPKPAKPAVTLYLTEHLREAFTIIGPNGAQEIERKMKLKSGTVARFIAGEWTAPYTILQILRGFGLKSAGTGTLFTLNKADAARLAEVTAPKPSGYSAAPKAPLKS